MPKRHQTFLFGYFCDSIDRFGREQSGEETTQKDPQPSRIDTALTAFVSMVSADSRQLTSIDREPERPAAAFDPASGRHLEPISYRHRQERPPDAEAFLFSSNFAYRKANPAVRCASYADAKLILSCSNRR